MEIQKYDFMDLSFPSEMTKKDCKNQGEQAAKEIINSGEQDLHEVMSNVTRLLEVGKSFEKEIRDELINEQKEKEYMEKAIKLWQEEGLPQLKLKEPWWGYNLGYWTDEHQRWADRAVRGEYYKTGEERAQNRTKP